MKTISDVKLNNLVKKILDKTDKQITTLANNKANSNHTHNYAGSSEPGGAATSANKLSTNKGLRVNLSKNSSNGYDIFNGTQDIDIGVNGVLPVDKGGTGVSSYPALSNKLKQLKMSIIPYTGNGANSRTFTFQGINDLQLVILQQVTSFSMANLGGTSTFLDEDDQFISKNEIIGFLPEYQDTITLIRGVELISRVEEIDVPRGAPKLGKLIAWNGNNSVTLSRYPLDNVGSWTHICNENGVDYLALAIGYE